jgi:hypothetical protein
MTVIRPLILLATAVLLAACASSPRVHSNADPQADFSRYQSFGFVQPAGTDRGEYATILTTRLQQAARQALEARGYRYDPASPDLLVNFNLSAQRVLESDPRPTTAGVATTRTGGAGTAPGPAGTTNRSGSSPRARSTSTWSTPANAAWSGKAWRWPD